MAETYRTEASPSETGARLLWPRQSLAGCIFCAIVRDTRGVELSEGQRFNHFPSTPFCTLHWLLDGQGHAISSPEHVVAPATGAPIPRFSFFGPQQGPSHTWNPGQVRFLTLVMYPEAFALLTGADLAAQLNRMAPAEQVLPETMLGQLGQFLHPQNAATDCPTLFHAVEEQFDTWWRAARPDRHAVTIWLRDWTMSLAARAATSGAGRSVRQVQRRVKSWTGHSIRELQAFGSTETLFAHFGARKIREDIDWARLAAASGFADQSHMTRHVRRRTGFTPAQFSDLVERDETFWFYRLLGERYWSRAAAAELLES